MAYVTREYLALSRFIDNEEGVGSMWMPSRSVLSFCLSGALLAIASLTPETLVSLFSALGSAVAFSYALRSARRYYLGAFCAGVCFHTIAFYWVPQTIQVFGGFSSLGAWGVGSLFIISASLQFVLVAFLFQKFRSQHADRICIALPLVWMIAEWIFPRLFPWQIGHALIVFSPIAGCAEVVGVTILSGLLLWTADAVVALFAQRSTTRSLWPLFVTLLLACSFGWFANARTRQAVANSPRLKVGLVQGNLSTDEKGNVSLLTANIAKYRAMTRQIVEQGAEVAFWPESVVNSWLPEQLENVRGTQFDPIPGQDVPLVYGTLGYSSTPRQGLGGLDIQRYNSAVGIDSLGNIVGRYYKRVLMPFGEYLPFEDTFPWLRDISPQTGDFASGVIETPIVLRSVNEAIDTLAMGLLICYEDLIPAISAQVVRNGANLLVNLTNDAWYGDTAAPHQHHLLAQWRAIETRRYFLRVTNTGLTAIVDPFGRTQAKLPVFGEHVLVDDVSVLTGETVFVRYGKPLSVTLLLALSVFCGLLRIREKRAETP